MDSTSAAQFLDYFDNLPRSQDEFFRQLWRKGKLWFDDAETGHDEIDLKTAQLLCETLVTQRSLLVVLPDHAPQRVPLLFATALITYALDHIQADIEHSVIYFGDSAAIKAYLSKTYIGGEKLSDIFKQAYIGKNTTQAFTLPPFGKLPHLVFSCSPLEPEALINKVRPQWVFLDCGDGANSNWINRVVDFCFKRKIQLLACSQNLLSQCVEHWSKMGWGVFYWNMPSESSTQPSNNTHIIPVVLESETASIYSEKYRNVYHLLCESTKLANGRFQQDSTNILWRYLRGLESLPVPFDFFEAEVKQFWGIRSISMLRNVASQFLKALGNSKIAGYLRDAQQELETVYQNQQTCVNPLWIGLQHLCIDPPARDEANIMVFQNAAYKQLFALALLAKENISEIELAEMKVWLSSVKQLAQWQLIKERCQWLEEECVGLPEGLDDFQVPWHPILVGLPMKRHYCHYSFLLQSPKVEILTFPHQFSALQYHLQAWKELFDQTTNASLLTLKSFLNFEAKVTFPNKRSLSIGSEKHLAIEKISEESTKKLKALIKLRPRTEEFALLMNDEDQENQSDFPVESVSDNEAKADFDTRTIAVEEALHISFVEGQDVMLHLHDTVQVISPRSHGKITDIRSARSLKPNDKILFINGQRRQSLYDLIISRVHAHPTFTLHLNLIQRWKDELIASYKKSDLSVDDLLSKMQKKGSKLETTIAIKYWLSGEVMCPLDTDDLQRVADLLGMTFTKQYHKQIANAASRLRGIHRGLARKLNSWLERGGALNDESEMIELIDPELGLSFKDFYDALMILTVQSVDVKKGLFLTSDFGQLKKRG
ncbi:hypothetical protein DCC62_11320 [candidate division KSB1 bacterium]|nr:MAG: hypothetical protein DCC62_11320 [candidate division KSB1 bacterium]